MRRLILACASLISLVFVHPLTAQSTISNQPLELSFGSGVWAALLPSYDLGVSPGNGPAFHDDLDNAGMISQIKAVRRFLGTRTSLEGRGFYAFANANADTGPRDMDIPNPATGANTSLTGGRSHLDGDVDHYGFDIALRDTWRTRFGGLSAGCGFSTMAFDQDFNAEYGGTRLLREKLDSDFVGGKGFVGWDGCLYGRQSNLDLAVGFYDLDTDYEFIGGSIAGSLQRQLSESATTVESSFTTRTYIGCYQIGFTVGAMYISDLPRIQHNVGAATTLQTDDAVTLTGMVEILL